MRTRTQLILLIPLLLLGCSKDAGEPPNAARVSPGPPAEAHYRETLPKVGGAAGYVGSDACQSCHKEEHASWHRSYHRTMTQVASDESVQADFNNVVLETDTTRFTLNRKDGEYWVRMEPAVTPPATEGPAPYLDQRVGLITGSHHMQVFWLPEGDGNIQLGFPFTWLIPEKRWVPRNSTFVRPPDTQHNAEVWNIVCSRCHATGVEPHVNMAARTVDTRVAEFGISCEACHGPGERHVNAQKNSGAGPKTVAAGEIVHPKEISAERSGQICGFCHSMKWIDQSSGWRQNGFEYRPGDDLEKTTPIIRPAQVDAIPALKDYLARNPEILRDFFWPDGMVRVSGREYNGILESPCYKSGKYSCVSCHSMHDSEPDDQLASRAIGNSACIQCHEKFENNTTLLAHTHHQPNSSGSECYNCHMPHTTYGILKAIRSHQVSSPSVAEDLASGRPNACNLCHLDKTIGWTANQLQTWYGKSMPDLSGRETNVSHLVNLALSGDAGQRILAAWHFSWPPALQASGTNWTALFLAQLLDDPYAAVRCVAERSLKTNSVPLPTNYDFSIDPRARTAVRDLLWTQWEKTKSPATANDQSVLLENGEILKAQFEAKVRKRDDREIRLRE